jgi:hypothetical protein
MRDDPPGQRPTQEAFDALLTQFRVAIRHDRTSLSRHRSKTLTFLIVGAVLFLAVGLGAIGFTWSKRNYRDDQSSLGAPLNREAETKAADSTARPITSMVALSQPDIPSIKQAMASCDADAAKHPDGLYFLVIPVAPATFEGVTSLMPQGTNFGSLSLIVSKDLLNGLESEVFTLSARPYGFSIIDTETAKTVNWNASGPSKFSQEPAPEVSKFQLGFDLGGNSLTWTPPYDRQKGNCYWVNVRLPGLPLRTHGSWMTIDMPRSFSLPFATLLSSAPP